MDFQDQQYERVARCLDGEEISLTADERRLADEIGRIEVSVGPAMDVNVSAHIIQRALRRRQAAELKRSRRILRFKLAGAGLIAAAAMVLLALSVLWRPILPPSSGYDVAQQTDIPRPRSSVSMMELLSSLETSSDFDLELDLLAAELDQEEFEIATTPDTGQEDEEILDMQENIRNFWEEEPWIFLDEDASSG